MDWLKCHKFSGDSSEQNRSTFMITAHAHSFCLNNPTHILTFNNTYAYKWNEILNTFFRNNVCVWGIVDWRRTRTKTWTWRFISTTASGWLSPLSQSMMVMMTRRGTDTVCEWVLYDWKKREMKNKQIINGLNYAATTCLSFANRDYFNLFSEMWERIDF